ncbi:two-component system sensor histidine kinase/response regulator [Tsuneonella deserti]|uniref:histidine kinase n=1 Tax=Tsuneonella deserti TaxID=2035528 RepID=A0ABQ1S7M7_9SPHN|nr:two-component system sensor histidine kinase/response regulator [Tsuneonella deserti]
MVEVAENAETGMARLREEEFDLVAIDHSMPGRSGLEMLSDIVALEEHPPVVFVTGNDDTAVAVKALHAGALDFVVKTVGDSFFDMLDGRFRQALSRDRLEQEKRLAESNLREANERLEMMVREVHHRVSNSLQMVLSFVSMQGKQSKEPAVRSALEDIQNRIKAISKVHQRLYTRGDLNTIDLDAYLATLVEDLRQSLPAPIEISLTADPVTVTPDTAVSIGVIVNELVSNAAKYAFEPGQRGRVSITLKAVADGEFTLSVEDDGQGIRKGSEPAGTGFGTRIVDAIARSLRTKVVMLDGSRGTAMQITVKKASERD